MILTYVAHYRTKAAKQPDSPSLEYGCGASDLSLLDEDDAPMSNMTQVEDIPQEDYLDK